MLIDILHKLLGRKVEYRWCIVARNWPVFSNKWTVIHAKFVNERYVGFVNNIAIPVENEQEAIALAEKFNEIGKEHGSR